MYTDNPPQGKDRADYLESDRIKTLDLPTDALLLPGIAKNIEAAMQTGKTTDVRVACAEFLSQASRFYQIHPAASGCWQHDRLKAANG